jgi:hypothetical protein
VVVRAHVILSAADGQSTDAIAQLSVRAATVSKWRRRLAELGWPVWTTRRDLVLRPRYNSATEQRILRQHGDAAARRLCDMDGHIGRERVG